MMRAFFLYGVLASLVLSSVGCNADGTVLWYEEPSGSAVGSGAGQTTGSVTGSGAGGAGIGLPPPSTGSLITTGVDRPPGLVICEEVTDPNEPICTCPQGAICMCLPSPVGSPCDMTCPEGGCIFDCLDGVVCNNDCTFGCSTLCQPGSICNKTCIGGGCDVTCLPEAECYLHSIEGPSFMQCDLGSVCNCYESEGCFCSGDGCPP